MSRFSILLVFLLLPLWAAEKFPDSVVKLNVTTATPDYKRPWESSRIGRYIGSGVLIGDGYSPRLLILDTLDGRPVKSFDDLVERLEHNTSRFVRFRFMDDYRMIFDDAQMRDGKEKMKRMYHLHTLEETR